MRDSDTENDTGDAGYAPPCTAWWLLDTTGLLLPNDQLPHLDWAIPHDGLVAGRLPAYDPAAALHTAYQWAELLDLEITDYDDESVTWAGQRGLLVLRKETTPDDPPIW